MALQVETVKSEVEVMRSPLQTQAESGGMSHESGDETLGALRGRNQLREQLRPLVLEIMHDELDRMKRKVGSP